MTESAAELHDGVWRSKGRKLLLMAAWFGLLTGLAEVCVLAIQKIVFHKFVLMSQAFVWLTPLAELLVFVPIGAVLALVSLRARRLASPRNAVFLFAFLGSLSLTLFIPRLHPLASMLLAAGLAAQAARGVAAHQAGFDALVSRTTAWIAIVVVLLGLAVHGALWVGERRALVELPPAPPHASNVLLIVLDTVRAQNLSLNGYARPTTPNLKRLARGGARFERALSSAPWTLPSHSTLFTGRWPHELNADWEVPLDDTYATLAEVFRDHGYLTAAFVANTRYVSYEQGLDRGFLHYEDYSISTGQLVTSSFLQRLLRAFEGHYGPPWPWAARRRTPDRSPAEETGELVLEHRGKARPFRPLRPLRQLRQFLQESFPPRPPESPRWKPAPMINRDFLQWLDADLERPFFVFLNYMDCHSPYVSPSIESEILGGLGESPNAVEGRRELTDTYDASIAYLDGHIGKLFDELQAHGALDNTLVIITSDHGELLGEHGLSDHANSLYIQLLHVPLLIIFPGHVPASASVADFVTLRDVPATVLDLLNLDSQVSFPGRSLARFWGKGVEPLTGDNTLLAEVSKGIRTPESWPVSKGDMKSLVINAVHYIRNGDGIEELYDLETDPAEERDFARSSAGIAMLDDFRKQIQIRLAHTGSSR